MLSCAPLFERFATMPVTSRALRLALLPGVEFIVDNDDRPHPQAHIEGAPL